MNDRKKKSPRTSDSACPDHSRRSVPEWLAVKLDFPPDILSGGMRLELRGRNTLLVHGCRKILHYTPQEMRLLVSECVLSVTGERLVCHSYLSGAVGIEGKVNSLCFSDEML